ncbi:MAG: hypothetical protein ACNA7O_07180 [Rhodobacterales bacterium]
MTITRASQGVRVFVCNERKLCRVGSRPRPGMDIWSKKKPQRVYAAALITML